MELRFVLRHFDLIILNIEMPGLNGKLSEIITYLLEQKKRDKRIQLRQIGSKTYRNRWIRCDAGTGG